MILPSIWFLTPSGLTVPLDPRHAGRSVSAVPTVLAAASYLRKAHVDLLVIQGLLGHESVATTEIYPRVSAARQRQAIQALEGGNRA
jgi:integrase